MTCDEGKVGEQSKILNRQLDGPEGEKENCDSQEELNYHLHLFCGNWRYTSNEEGIRFVPRREDLIASRIIVYEVSKNIHLIFKRIYIYIYKRDLDREAAPIYRMSDCEQNRISNIS